MADHVMSETVPVRVTRKRYKELKRIAKANGHTLSWLLNYALDLYFQSLQQEPSKPTGGQGGSPLVEKVA